MKPKGEQPARRDRQKCAFPTLATEVLGEDFSPKCNHKTPVLPKERAHVNMLYGREWQVLEEHVLWEMERTGNIYMSTDTHIDL